VDERPTIDDAEVDLQVDAVSERGEARRRIIAIEAEVKCEMIPGTRGDDDEGQPVLGGNACNQCLCTVAPRDAQQVGPASHGATGDRLDVHRLRTFDHEDLGA